MANPTSNFGWQMPTSTDLVTDLPADFEVFGQAVDTTTKNLNPSTTLGDIEYRSATSNTNTRLGIGSSGQVLTVSGGVPSWATATVGGNPSWSLISTTTMSGSSVSLTGLTLNNYVVWLHDYQGSSSGQDVRMTLNGDTTAANYDQLIMYGSQAQSYRGDVGAFDIGNINTTWANFVEVKSAQQSGFKKVRSIGGRTSGGDSMSLDGFYKSSSAVTSIQIFPTGGTFSSGTIYLYGGA